MHATVGKRASLQHQFLRQSISTGSHSLFDQQLNVLNQVRMILMPHAGSDEMRRLQVFFGEHLCHVLSGIALGVDFTGVANQGNIKEITSVVGHIVDAPKFLLVPGRHLVRCNFLITFYIDKPCSGMHTRPLVRKVSPDVPCACSAHTESGQSDAIIIDMEACNGIISGFKNIGFPSALPTIAIASEGMNDNGPFGLELARLLCIQSTVNKMQVGCSVATTVKPNPHRDLRLVVAKLQPLWDLDTVGLWRVIDLGVEPDYLLAASFHPRCLIDLQRRNAIGSLIEQCNRFI